MLQNSGNVQISEDKEEKKETEDGGLKFYLFIHKRGRMTFFPELPIQKKRRHFRQARGSGSSVGKQRLALRRSLGEIKSCFSHYFEGGRTGISLYKERISAEPGSLAK